MNTATYTPQNSISRFAAIFHETKETQPLHNQPLYECDDWLVVPTLGAIVPNWTIVLPTQPALCLRSWRRQYGKQPQDIIRTLSTHLRIDVGDFIWFEHGPSRTQSSVGCGTDYAHLHVLFNPTFTFGSFLRNSIRRSQLEWTIAHSDHVYDELPDDHSYLMAASGQASAFVSHVECLGSQYFRRIVSLLSGKEREWNYRTFPHFDNIRRTADNFRSLQTASHLAASFPSYKQALSPLSQPLLLCD